MDTVQIDNPVTIDRIEATKTKGGTPQISLYSGALEYPVLNLAPFSYGMLFSIGIDPNELQPGQPRYCQFLAQWAEVARTNGNGRPYKNVTALYGMQAPPSENERQALIHMARIDDDTHEGRGERQNILKEMQSIKLLLTYLAEQQPGGREALIKWYKSREEK